ncbi:MAG: GMC oxidoreductase [Steroidobacterales bacterium]
MIGVEDLRLGAAKQRLSAQVCIIGSGPAGLALCRALTERGVGVVLLEAGDAAPRLLEAAQWPECLQHDYKGATLGRSFGLGGTSALWGGQLLPLRPEEMRARAHCGASAWPIRHQEIAAHYALIERWVGVVSAPYNLDAMTLSDHPLAQLDWNGLAPRFSKWIPMRRRNLATAWLPGIIASGRARVVINATVQGWETVRRGDAAEVVKILARSDSDHQLEVEAPLCVICAGALESTRLALELSAKCPEGGSVNRALLGQGLQDHLSVRLGELQPRAGSRFAALFAPFFSGSTMRSLRLDLPPQLAEQEGLPAAYLHIVAEAAPNSGFAAVRDTLRSLQAHELRRAVGHGLRGLGALPEVLELLYGRAIRRRLLFPRRARLWVNLDFEQPQQSENRLSLSEQCDASGRRRLQVRWSPPVCPARLIAVMTRQLQTCWQRNDLSAAAELKLFDAQKIAASMPDNLYDIYHPARTTRMGASAQNGVVDPDLRLFGTTNCYVLSSSVFPSMGAANPTFTLMALALRLAAHLASARARSA